MRNWSSSVVRILVLIAGIVVALEASHILSISITLYAITQDFKNTRTVVGIAVGISLSALAAVPGRKKRSGERGHKIPSYTMDRAKTWRNAQHLRVIVDSIAKHSDIR